MNRLLKVFGTALLGLFLLTACTKTPSPVETPPEASPQTLQEETELSVFDGIYRANVSQEADETYLQITAHGDFLLLEHILCMDGSVYSFRAEEFWPYEDGLTAGDFTSASGMSQTFSGMTEEPLYDTMPRHRVISLTDAGVVLNYDDSDAEYYERDTAFTYHTPREELLQRLDGSETEENEALIGTWLCRNGREAVCVTFREDGGLSFLRKVSAEPAAVYEGAFRAEKSGDVTVMAEKVGDGLYPHVLSWQWHIDPDGMLWLTFENEEQLVLLPTQEAVTRTVESRSALGYLGAQYDLSGEYTDAYDTDYVYTFRLPRFLGSDPEAIAVNEEIAEKYSPIIEEELRAIEQGEFLTFTDVNWESNVHEGILYLHIYAKTWDWEEHSAYYYDVDAGTFLTTREVLARLLIDEDYFLEAVREYAQAAFIETFADLPEQYREEYGYYEMLEWTVSDEAVNFDLPIFADRFGSIHVHAKIGSMAGSGIIWNILQPFDGAVG